MRRLSLATSDGLTLEAELAPAAAAAPARAGVALCHPHPQYGGSMRSIVISALFEALPPAGFTCLRFNFRGVEGSEGAYDDGNLERVDAEAAVAALGRELGRPDVPIVLAGWSFGADMALSVRVEQVAAWLAIAPPLRFVHDVDGLAGDPRPKLLALAQHDEVRDPTEVSARAERWANTEVQVVGGASHFFMGRTDRLVELALAYLDRLAARWKAHPVPNSRRGDEAFVMSEQEKLFAYQPALDGLRAVAVGSVIAYHLGEGWARGGFLGVDAFFVLSGYLITSLLLVEWAAHGRIDFAAFWARRARRLLPALFLVVVAVAIYAAVAVPADELSKLRGDGLATLFYGANWRLVFSGESYFDLFSNPSPFRHAWSLAIEEQFYIVWPLVTFACLRIARGRRWALGGVCVVGTALSMLAMAALYEPGGDPSRAYYGTDARAHALLIGVALAVVLTRWQPGSARAVASTRVVAVAGALYMLFAFTRIHDTDSWMYRGGYALFHVSVAVVILAVVQTGRWPLKSLLSVPAVVWIGTVSYGLYLWHWPVIVVMTPNRTGLHGGVLTLSRVGVTVAISALSFYLVEQPIRRGALSRLRIPRRLVFATAPAGFAVAGLALVVATAGAKPPPDFLRADPGKIISSADELPDLPSTTAPALPEGATADPAAGPQRVLLVGDSIAYSLYDSVKSAAYSQGVPVYQVVVSGCGVAGGLATDTNGTPFPWSQACIDAVPYEQRRVINQLQPDLVVWLSVWETSDRIVNGTLVRFGTKAGDKALRAEIDEAAQRLTAGGAQLALVTLPLPAEDAEVPPEIDYGPAIRRLNQLLREYAAEHPDTTRVVDLGEIVCPDGPPCPAEIAGVRPRPRDGVHYEGDGAVYVAQRLVPELLAPVPVTP